VNRRACIAVFGALALWPASPAEAQRQITRGDLTLDIRPDMSVRLFLHERASLRPVCTLLPMRVHQRSGQWHGSITLRSVQFDPQTADRKDLVRLVGALAGDSEKSREVVTTLEFQDDCPMAFLISSGIRLDGEAGIDSLESCGLEMPGPEGKGKDSLWSFQGGSYSSRPDWIFPIGPGYSRRNYQGMNAPDYGGGMPLVDFWSRQSGAALASVAGAPEPIALPVSVDARGTARVSLLSTAGSIVDGRLHTITAAVVIHRGDFFNALAMYATVMRSRGIAAAASPHSAHDVEWCAWGYERTFVPAQILASLSMARELGAGWATVDDGWQSADGDWNLNPVKFPTGDSDMKALTDSIHTAGMKARLWWVPLEAHDSAYSAAHFPDRMNEFGMRFTSDLSVLHPEWFQLNADGSRTQVSWWNSYTLCPAVPEVRAHYVKLVGRMISTWGFDGVKIDGQNMNAVPPCYNPAHRHASPEDAPRELPRFFRAIYAGIKAANPAAVVHVCACGTNFSMYHIPYVDQPVASDPLSPWQVRHRGKAYKALMGPSAPYSGDHVELTNRRWDEAAGTMVVTGVEDFASTIGVGGVPATKFTVRGVAQADSSLMLDPAKERVYRDWIALYNRLRLSEGEYRNLYDIAFDLPETHVVAKEDTLYYSLFSKDPYTGTFHLRGLGSGQYHIVNVVTGETMGMAAGSKASVELSFRGALLLKAEPR
jgi:alpha-galactosidase